MLKWCRRSGQGRAHCSALLERIVPVLQVDAAADRIGEVGDIADGEDIWMLGAQILVDHDAAINGQTCGPCQFCIQLNPDADDDQVGR